MTRKGESITLSLTEEDKAVLERLALQFNCTWGKKPNISALIKAIAIGELILISSSDPPKTKEEIKSKINTELAKKAISKIKEGLTEFAETLEK